MCFVYPSLISFSILIYAILDHHRKTVAVEKRLSKIEKN